MTVTVTVRGDGITVDLLLWRHYGVRGREALAGTLDLNPGLASVGVNLPLGTVVTLADLPDDDNTTTEVVDLFG